MEKKKIVILYFIISLIWIYGSNYLINQFVSASFVLLVERSKEIFHIMVTGGFVYFFISKKEELTVSQEHQKRLSTLITESIKMERLLAESQQQYKSLFDYSPDIVYLMDLNGNITNLNPQFDVITGFKRQEMLGKNIVILLPNRYKRFLNKFISTVVEEIKPVIYELNIPDAFGKTITLQCTSLPIIINGNITGIIGYGRDVTTLRRTEERLRLSEKLSIVGELSASVAHEIRNPLTSLKGFVQLLQMEDEKHQYYFQIMLDELNRINHIVGELLLLAKPQHLKYSLVDIHRILKDVTSLLRTEASLYNVQIEANFSEKELLIECDPNQLKQLFINLIKNSIDASSQGGTVSIMVEEVKDDYILLTITDNGCGISKGRLAKIGEPFYSSKDKGTGLGLTVSFKIVQSHHGTITFDSLKNQGTTVYISLPVQQDYAKNHHHLATEEV
jgi:two-component system, sporulation sensor kinase E